MDTGEWNKTIAMMMAAFPAWKVDRGVSAIWFSKLGRYSKDHVDNAIEVLSRDNPSPFPPTLYQIIGEVERMISGQELEQVDEEWQKCLKLSQSSEPNCDGLSDRTKFALKSIGGLKQLGLTWENKLDFVKNDFKRAWADFTKKETRSIGRGVKSLPGATSCELEGVSKELIS